MNWALGRLNCELHELIAARRNQPGEGDLLGVLLAAHPPLDEQAVCQILVSVLLASHGVPAAALAWVWYLLACHPEAGQHLHDELDCMWPVVFRPVATCPCCPSLPLS
jgi:cytochrome P450